MVVDAPEVEPGAVAPEVTGIRRWMRTLPLQDRKTEEKVVARAGVVDVEVPEAREGDANPNPRRGD
jgi:hypothetical protein